MAKVNPSPEADDERSHIPPRPSCAAVEYSGQGGAVSNDMEQRIARLEDAVISIKDSLVALVRLEAHHTETREALSRAFKECEKLGAKHDALVDRVSALEKDIPPLKEARTWLVTGMLGTLGLVGLAHWSLLMNNRHDHEAHCNTRPPLEKRADAARETN